MKKNPKSENYLANLIRSGMERKGYNETETAKLVPCSVAFVSQILSGDRKVLGLRFAVGFANALDISIFDLATALEADPYLTVIGLLESGDTGVEESVKGVQRLERIPKPTWLTEKNSLAVRVKGSRFGERLHDGDLIVLVKLPTPVKNGSNVGVRLKSGRVLYKQYWQTGDTITLQSLHGGAPLTLPRSEIEGVYRLATIIPSN